MNNALHKSGSIPAKPPNVEIVAQSETIRNILEQLKTAALTDRTVLLIGETGAGKELFAEYLHQKSGLLCSWI